MGAISKPDKDDIVWRPDGMNQWMIHFTLKGAGDILYKNKPV